MRRDTPPASDPTGDPEWSRGRARWCKASICPEAPSSWTCRWFSFIFFPQKKEKEEEKDKASPPASPPR